METVYGGSGRTKHEKKVGRRTAQKRTGRERTGGRERRRLLQLVVCILLFAVAFFGKGRLPEGAQELRQTAMNIIRTDTDFKTAFSNFGRAISRGEPALRSLEGLFQDVFGMHSVTVGYVNPRAHAPTYEAERALLFSQPGVAAMIRNRLGLPDEAGQAAQPEGQGPPEAEEEPHEEEPAALPVEEEIPVEPPPVYTGPPLPDGASMERPALALATTVTPVEGVLTSAFGYRDHPVDGENKFHYGVDVAADAGAAVAAFADGVVDYIGESEVYGQYIQLRHANGVTTFYAHCSELCAQKGQTVTAGQTIARAGETGNATGPHLHFELRQGGVYLNPAYYIQTQ